MKKIQSFALMMASALTGTVGFTACSSETIDENVVYDSSGHAGVKSEFVISIPRSVVRTKTRMSDAITQKDGTVTSFRGIDNIRLIAFDAVPTSTSVKSGDIISLEDIDALNSPGQVNYKVYADQFVPVGTKHFLFYGKAMQSSSDMFVNGVVNSTGLTNTDFEDLSSIRFSLQQINTSSDPQAGDATGQAIVALLSALANTTDGNATAPNDKWSTTTNHSLATLYSNFISLTTGSSTTLAAILSRLYFAADHVLPADPARGLADAIRSQIEGACSSLSEGQPATLKSTYTGYPTNLGLPDGAARLKWDPLTSSFKDISAVYSPDFKQEITDYLYPAALWYYVSTPLKAAAARKSSQYDSRSSWNDVITNVYQGAGETVEAGTQSIALRDPVQYAVGRIETTIKMGEGTFYDRNGKVVTVGDGYTLKGFLLGGQNTVDYNFSALLHENKPIYDREVSGVVANVNSTSAANQTLALETYKDQVIYAALELVNGGSDFMGADGIIPAGGTFYLVVKLDPQAPGSGYREGILDKIVIQDHVTQLIVTIKNGQPHIDYVKDGDGKPIGIDTDGDGTPDNVPYDINDDGNPDKFISDPTHGGPGWDTDGDGEVDIPVEKDPETGEYPDSPSNPDGLGTATNGIPDLSSPSIELGTSVDLEWRQGLKLTPEI